MVGQGHDARKGKGNPARRPEGAGHAGRQIADVHCGASGRFGRLPLRLSGQYRTSRPSGRVSVPASSVAALLSGGTWATVDTGTRPDGAIRGQIRPT